MEAQQQEYLLISVPYNKREAMRLIPGCRWDPFARAWKVPVTSAAATALRDIPGVAVPEALRSLLPAAAQDPIGMFDVIEDGIIPISPMPLRLQPYKHQIAAYNAAVSAFRAGRRGYALLHEQGCGKTATTEAVMGRLYLDGMICRVLVVAPLAVLPVWEKDCADMTVPYALSVIHGTAAQRKKAWTEILTHDAGRLQIAVINYDGIRGADNLEAIEAWAPDMIICDESQRIKNHKAKQSKVLHSLGAKVRYRMILTGTPVGNTPLDFWSQYKFLDAQIFERSYYAFRNHYAVMGGYGGYELIKYKCLDDLTKKAHSIAHRVTKAQALDLPARIDQTLYCELEPAAARIYKQMARDKVAELSRQERVTAQQIITQMLRLSQITGGYLAPDDGQVEKVSRAKMTLLRETLTDLQERGEKAVIFCRFRPEITDVCRLLEEMAGKDGYRGIWGDISADARGEAVQAFQTQPHVRFFVAQIQCAGAGITLHAASTAIFYSLDYSFMNYDQAKARIHRIGQHRPCTYLHLVTKGTIDEEVIRTLGEKRSIAETIVDNWRRVFAVKD